MHPVHGKHLVTWPAWDFDVVDASLARQPSPSKTGMMIDTRR